MKTSARNQFSGTIKALTKGPVSTEVIIEVVSGMRIVATISTVSAESLGLAAFGARLRGIKTTAYRWVD
jgi:molybdate transport system regulatory protein